MDDIEAKLTTVEFPPPAKIVAWIGDVEVVSISPAEDLRSLNAGAPALLPAGCKLELVRSRPPA